MVFKTMSEYYTKEICSLNIFEMNWECTTTEIMKVPSVINYPVFDLNLQMSLLFLGIASLLGVLIVELISSKSDYLLDPLCNAWNKRRAYVKKRDGIK